MGETFFHALERLERMDKRFVEVNQRIDEPISESQSTNRK